MAVLFVHVVLLFNRDTLRIPIEDLNHLIKKHLNVVCSRNPSKEITQLESDVSELLMPGMVGLNSRLSFGSQNSNGSQNGLHEVCDDGVWSNHRVSSGTNCYLTLKE